MTEQTKSNEQLNTEITYLRQQNQALSAELAFHRQMFNRVKEALGAARELSAGMKGDMAVTQLAKENERLRSQLKFARLSDREKEIMKYIVHGYTSKEMAEHLNISKLTVDTHRKRIQQKLEVDNVVELLKIAAQVDFN